MMRRVHFLLCAAVLVACTEPGAIGPDPDGPRQDSGTKPRPDAGDKPSTSPDARPGFDAGPGPRADASFDAGSSPDSGPGPIDDFGKRPGLAVYWGQNGYGGANPGNPALYEKSLAEVCQNPDYDIVILAFATSFVSARNADGLPELNFAFHCDTPYDQRNPFLLRCANIEAGIETCHSKGKKVLLSLGGAAGAYGFTSDAQAERFAETTWDMFLGGSGAVRPFGRAVLDGVDLDIEGGSTIGYTAYVKKLRGLMSQDTTRSYYVAAAPQCPYPDAYVGPAPGRPLGDVPAMFDWLFVQFYNNYCNFNQRASFEQSYAQWTSLATGGKPKIFVGLPATPQAANAASFVGRADLQALVDVTAKSKAFGGVMLWDSSYDQNSSEGGQTYGALVASLLRKL
ncbi:MAG: hypothetical protein HY698_06900 [Deltaproteobacteria bacterium]|nr:hypothetical protein [Deltaproteobacteria bacterium]